jgi:cytochrome bd ubiquinol oxidase subunit II
MQLHDVWFLLIAVLWTGYFFLEGFDFGVGILTGVLARGRTERRVLINTIGPVWDGNEVWLLAAGGATFAAFPDWYATLFSGFYLPMLAILVCLIVRGVAFEYRAKRSGERWQRNWELAVFWCSLVPAFLWGVAFANIVRGMPIGPDMDYTGNLLDLLHPYALLGGLVTLVLFTFHGAVFVALKTVGDIRARARRFAARLGLAAVVLGAVVLAGAYLAWARGGVGGIGVGSGSGGRCLAALCIAVASLVAALVVNHRGREGWAFSLSGVTVVASSSAVFLALFPDVLPSSLDPRWSLTVANAASSPYTLRIMTWVAAIMTPIVLAYQAWTYWVFRKRIGTQHIPPQHVPASHEPDSDPDSGGVVSGGGVSGGGVSVGVASGDVASGGAVSGGVARVASGDVVSGDVASGGAVPDDPASRASGADPQVAEAGAPPTLEPAAPQAPVPAAPVRRAAP